MVTSTAVVVVWLSVMVVSVSADIFLQNPRGSNSRANEQNAQRNNNFRLFNSQNNNRGGYNIGDRTNTPNSANTFLNSPDGLYSAADTTTPAAYPMVYYEQSVLQ